jgi:hypothetical protein
MALSVTISGVSFDATEDYSIRQQGSAVSSTTINVLLANQILPRSLQSCVLSIDGTPVFGGVIKTVGTPTWSTGYESNVFALTVQSWEVALQYRLVTKTWYNKTYSEILGDLWTDYISEEHFTLGGISTTSTTIKKYSVTGKTVFDVLTDIATQVGAAAFWISPDKTFYFQVASGFVAATVPDLVSGLKQSDDYSDLRTVQAVTGASSSIKGTATNTDLVTEIAALSGLSGKIEKASSDSAIHNPTAAATRAQELLGIYDEREKTLDAICHDLVASQLFRAWTIDRSDLGIQGVLVVTERTITHFVGSEVQVSLKLKNRGYFSRYGYALKTIADTADSAVSDLSDLASDSKLTPVEKLQLRTTWSGVAAEVASLDNLATTYGQDTEKMAFNAAFHSLADYLNGGTSWTSGYPKWISDDEVGATTDIDSAEWASYWEDYNSAKVALTTACNSAAVSFVEETVAKASGTGYLGVFDENPSASVIGDYYYNTTSHLIKVLESSGWVTDTDSSHFAAAAPDILAVEGAALSGNAQAIAYIQALVGKDAFFDAIKARTLEVTGTIHATDGEFSGELKAAYGVIGAMTAGRVYKVDYPRQVSIWGDVIAALIAAGAVIGTTYKGGGAFFMSSATDSSRFASQYVVVNSFTINSTTSMTANVTSANPSAGYFNTVTSAYASTVSLGVTTYTVPGDTFKVESFFNSDVIPSGSGLYLGSPSVVWKGAYLDISNLYPVRGGIYASSISASGGYVLFTDGLAILFGRQSVTFTSGMGTLTFPYTLYSATNYQLFVSPSVLPGAWYYTLFDDDGNTPKYGRRTTSTAQIVAFAGISGSSPPGAAVSGATLTVPYLVIGSWRQT